ncbi:hypothetical protein Vadar_003559 [Vaccinium darrowii]|uniref:Uncharacterized protein n=1 Tax=Vaccinium darrowii TaxID=229202 RepID=A0ACB7YJC2_9ERIC|nr:hypothetical protein Vadar_003559 [Vaccinium darrowii]
MEVVKRALGMDGSLWVEPAGLAGGLAVFWKGAQTVEVQRMCSWFIDVKIQETDGGSSWRLINVYFSSRVEVRRAQWDVFVQYKNCLGEDWAIWGDMNNIVSIDEKKGGVLPLHSSLRGFQDFISSCQLLDLGFSGYPFTWRNNREGEGFIQERLDRVLVSPSWRTRFPHATVEHLDAIGSDHSALLLQLQSIDSQRRAPFKFDARWVQEEELTPVIQGAWNTQVQGSKFFNVHQKIKACRVSIQNWKKRKRFNSGQRINELKEQIHSIQNERNLHSRGRLQELRNQTRNRITGIENSAGEWVSGKAEIMSEFQQYFKDLFSANLELNMEHTTANIPSKVTSEMNSRLTRSVTAEEIHAALMAMHPTKAPGVDGIIDQLGSLAFCEAVKAGKYVLHYEKNLKKLQDELEDLNVRRECIEIKVREAIDGGEEIMPDVKNWQRKAEDMKTDVNKLIRQSTVKGNMHCIACSCPNIKWRYRLSKQAEQKILDVKALTEKDHFHEISHHKPTPLELKFPSDENFVNFDSRTPIFDDIVDALKDSSVNMVGVHGSGGVGKTTLVMEVGKKMGLERYFKQVALATIPKGRKVEEVQSQLADGLNFNFDPQKGPRNDQLWKKLTNGDKYLIILDDIWEKVDIKAIGHKVCNKCKGLPVAINAIGEALKDKRDFAWKDALVKLERYELMKIEGIDSTVGASLRLSYDLLESSNAKSFFLLCCLFRENAEIPIGDLTRHCLARRLFSRDPRTVEEVRNSVCTVIDALKLASLLSNGSHENVVTIHDIIRDVGISIAREENAFFVEQGARHWPENGPSYSAISLTSGKIQALPTELTCPKLHTLMFENSELSDLKVPDEFFSETTELSVLILTQMRMQQLPSSLGKLAKLRMLYLIECDLADIDILGYLNKSLEVLSLRGSSIQALPPKIGQLTRLRVLDLENCKVLKVIPQGVISKLTDLEELYFPDTFYEGEATTDKKQDASSSNNVNLEELRLSLTRGKLTVLHIHIPDVASLSKEGLKFENLKRFRVSVGSKLKKYYEDFSATRVLKYEGISLRNEFIPLVDNAEVLYLSGIKGLKKVFHDSGVRKGFLDLKYLKVKSCDDDLEYLLGEPKSSVQSRGQNLLHSFNKLTVLLINRCKLKYLFSSTTARGLVCLEQLKVSSCEIMEGIVGFEEQNDINEHIGEVKFDKLKQLKLENLPNLISFYAKKEKTGTTMGSSSAHPQPLFNEKVIFPVLEILGIRKMDNITEIWDKQSIAILEEQGSFCQLMDVNVSFCEQLTYVFLSKMHTLLKNLKELSVHGCGTMKGIVEFEGEIDEDGLIDEVAFPALEEISIYKVPNITEIWDKKPLPESEKETQSFWRLRDIDISKCNQLVYVLPSYMLPQLQINLQRLSIWNCKEVEVIVSKELKEKEATENEIIVFHQLKNVHFGYLRKLKSFYTGTELLFSDKVVFPSLESLDIVGLPKIKEIWPYKQPFPKLGKEVESFYKLSYIRVAGCEQLVYVFPFYILRQLQHLGVLEVWKCENLEVIVSKELKEKEVIHNDIVFPQLKTVRLWLLPNLKRFCTGMQLFFTDKVECSLPSLLILAMKST